MDDNREPLLAKFFEAGIAGGLTAAITASQAESSEDDTQLRETIELFSKECESKPRGDNLASFNDINEAFMADDSEALYNYAVKLRLALTELDAKVLNHIRNIITVGFGAQQLQYGSSSATPFLSNIPLEDQPHVLQYVLQTEAASAGLRLLQFDTDYAPADTAEAK